jgi:hypothetical protein
LLSDIVTLRFFSENATIREEQYHLIQKEIIKLQVIEKALEGILTVKESMESGLAIQHISLLLIPMARPLPIEYPEAVYHLTSRGNVRNDTYRDDQDR